jgi:hypothetical protein
MYQNFIMRTFIERDWIGTNRCQLHVIYFKKTTAFFNTSLYHSRLKEKEYESCKGEERKEWGTKNERNNFPPQNKCVLSDIIFFFLVYPSLFSKMPRVYNEVGHGRLTPLSSQMTTPELHSQLLEDAKQSHIEVKCIKYFLQNLFIILTEIS